MARNIVIAWTFLVALALVPVSEVRATALVLGSVSTDPSDELKDWVPFAEYLAAELARDGITEGKIVVTREGKEMAALLKAGKVDLYIDSPLVMIDVINASGSKLLARRWKKGVAQYTSVIFARKDAGIATLSDLQNKIIAFQKKSSSSGYLLPWLAIRNAGLTIEQLADPTAKPQTGEVGYLFSGADRNTVAWVLYGRVAAGGTSRGDYDEISEEQQKQLMIVVESAPIPRHVVVHRSDLSPALVARIKETLLAMDKSEAGRQALLAFEKTAKFDEIPPESLTALVEFEKAMRAARLVR